MKEKWFRTKSDKSHASGHVRPPGIALLVIYLFICLIPAGLVPHTGHDHHSDHDHSGHDHIIESDPCHISIYHAGLAGGCNHKYHFTENNPPCPLCKISLLPQITVDPVLWISQLSPSFPFIISLTVEIVWYTIILQEDRGPPQICFN